MVDMTKVTVNLSYDQINGFINDAAQHGLTLDEYILWALLTVRRLRFVPVLGTCR